MTDEDRTELARLEAKGSVEMTMVAPEVSLAWWKAHTVKRESFHDVAALPAAER